MKPKTTLTLAVLILVLALGQLIAQTTATPPQPTDKAKVSCCGGPDGKMSCCQGKDAKSCMRAKKGDAKAASCCDGGKCCGDDKTAASCCKDGKCADCCKHCQMAKGGKCQDGCCGSHIHAS